MTSMFNNELKATTQDNGVITEIKAMFLYYFNQLQMTIAFDGWL